MSIELSNGHRLGHNVVASGALAYDGRGWWFDKPLIRLGLIQPELFVITTKTLTIKPRQGNLVWWHPWTCVRYLKGGGVVNRVSLTNPGIEIYCNEIYPRTDPDYKIIPSIAGDISELEVMAKALNQFQLLVAIEVNDACPNTGRISSAEEVIAKVKVVKVVSKFPVLVKVSVAQDYLRIAEELSGVAEAISINSVPWDMVFPGQTSPLHRLGGGGGVSGLPAQVHNWKAVKELSAQNALPVIAPSVMSKHDVKLVTEVLGAQAVSFGAIFLHRPWIPTQIARNWWAQQET